MNCKQVISTDDGYYQKRYGYSRVIAMPVQAVFFSDDDCLSTSPTTSCEKVAADHRFAYALLCFHHSKNQVQYSSQRWANTLTYWSPIRHRQYLRPLVEITKYRNFSQKISKRFTPKHRPKGRHLVGTFPRS